MPVQEDEYGDVKEELTVQADWTGSYSVDERAASIEAVRAGERPVGDLFTATQREFPADCAGTPIQLDARAGQRKPTKFVRDTGFTAEPKQRPKTTLVLKRLVEQFLAQPR